MGINDLVAMASGFTDKLAKLRRDLIAYALCGICAVVAIVMAISASILALEPEVGAVYARLIVAGAFLFVALVAVLVARRAGHHAAAARPAPFGLGASEPRSQFAQMAMIVEAVMLGYAMSKRSNRR